jgi:DNA-binding beta-propeller fold protein YncE
LRSSGAWDSVVTVGSRHVKTLRTAVRATLVGCALAAVAAGSAFAAGNAYVTNYSGGSVSPYDIGPGGHLTSKGAAVAAGSSPEFPAISPDGRSLYVPRDAPNIAQFDIGAGGVLSPKTVPQAPGEPAPYAAAASPDGRSLYVANQGASISQYDIGAGGLLQPKSPATVSVAMAQFNAIAISPDGRTVWAPDSDNDNVRQFDIAADGTLTVLAGAVPAVPDPQGIAVTPDGRNVYVTSSSAATVAQYDVGAGGALTPKTPTTVPAGANPVSVAVSPDGRSAYVTSFAVGVFQYDIAPGGGLVAKSPASVPQPAAFAVALTPDGRSAYVTFNNDVAQYDVGPGGALTPKSPASVPAGNTAFGVVTTPDLGPVAAFAATARPARSPSLFDASASSDPDDALARFDWNFGDGTTGPNAGPTPAHTYANPGTYQVTLTVTDARGCNGALVFTGQTASCSPSAGTVSQTVVIPAGPAPPAARFGRRTLVTLRLARSRIPAKGPVPVIVSNRNPFAVRGALGGRTVAPVTVSRRRRVGLRSKSFNVRASGRRTVRLALPRPLRRVLRTRRRLALRLRARVRDPAGNRRTVTKTVRPRLKRRRAR